MVTVGSVVWAADGVTYHFRIHDNGAELQVSFKGILPDLLKEGSRVVAEGAIERGTFVAPNLLAKHDERYRRRKSQDDSIKLTPS